MSKDRKKAKPYKLNFDFGNDYLMLIIISPNGKKNYLPILLLATNKMRHLQNMTDHQNYRIKRFFINAVSYELDELMFYYKEGEEGLPSLYYYFVQKYSTCLWLIMRGIGGKSFKTQYKAAFLELDRWMNFLKYPSAEQYHTFQGIAYWITQSDVPLLLGQCMEDYCDFLETVTTDTFDIYPGCMQGGGSDE